MQLSTYLFGRYAADLEAMAGEHKGTGVNQIHLCDCVEGSWLRQRMRTAGVTDPLWFPILLCLEATLQAGVHTYDRPNHDAYVRKVGCSIIVKAHGAYGTQVHKPHAILRALPARTDPADIATACDEILPAWAGAYDHIGVGGAGERVLTLLANDPDLQHVYWTPPSLHAAFLGGVRRAPGLVLVAQQRP